MCNWGCTDVPVYFNPLPPCGGRPPFSSTKTATQLISIHSLRVEGDRDGTEVGKRGAYFNPLPPCGGRLRWGYRPQKKIIFQSTPSVWRETYRYRLCWAWQMISIHSLRVEGDYSNVFTPSNFVVFQSTPSVWRETTLPAFVVIAFFISIHSLRVEGDQPEGTLRRRHFLFQSTPSVWRETDRYRLCRAWQMISIHSLRVEGDNV